MENQFPSVLYMQDSWHCFIYICMKKMGLSLAHKDFFSSSALGETAIFEAGFWNHCHYFYSHPPGGRGCSPSDLQTFLSWTAFLSQTQLYPAQKFCRKSYSHFFLINVFIQCSCSILPRHFYFILSFGEVQLDTLLFQLMKIVNVIIPGACLWIVILPSQFPVDELSLSVWISISYLRYSSKPESICRREMMTILGFWLISLVL